ncbi:MAG: AAA family ATPase [Methylobacteriaceae bacterium]|nr:AAA family ATPase [Methylobacteriaceae bacterium]
MLRTLAVANYRSLRKLVIPLERLNIVTGPNGSGKSSLYRALRLLAETSQGGLVASLAREGGLQSTLWAGPEQISRGMRSGRIPVQGGRRQEPVHLRLGFGSADFGYAIDLGLPIPSGSAFALDPAIKRECIWAGALFRRAALLIDRHGPVIRATDETGAWQVIPGTVSTFESMMTEFSDPRSAPEMIAVRERVRSWRFYDHFRTDAAAPARQPQVGTHTPVLSDDGADLAAALQTIREIGDARGLDAAVEDAFPGARIDISGSTGWLELNMRQHGLLRPLRAAELSDGTLRYLLLIAVLLTPRPPELLVLNEPETSLHGDLVPALGRLIAAAAMRSQVIVVTHNDHLIAALGSQKGSHSIRLEKVLGETQVEGLGLLDRPPWEWPAR